MQTPPDQLIRLPQVLKRFPVSRSQWYAGVKNGIYPQPVKLSARSVAWWSSSIDGLINSLPKPQ